MSFRSNLLKVFFLSLSLLALSGMAMASDIGSPDIEVTKGLYPLTAEAIEDCPVECILYKDE